MTRRGGGGFVALSPSEQILKYLRLGQIGAVRRFKLRNIGSDLKTCVTNNIAYKRKHILSSYYQCYLNVVAVGFFSCSVLPWISFMLFRMQRSGVPYPGKTKDHLFFKTSILALNPARIRSSFTGNEAAGTWSEVEIQWSYTSNPLHAILVSTGTTFSFALYCLSIAVLFLHIDPHGGDCARLENIHLWLNFDALREGINDPSRCESLTTVE